MKEEDKHNYDHQLWIKKLLNLICKKVIILKLKEQNSNTGFYRGGIVTVTLLEIIEIGGLGLTPTQDPTALKDNHSEGTFHLYKFTYIYVYIYTWPISSVFMFRILTCTWLPSTSVSSWPEPWPLATMGSWGCTAIHSTKTSCRWKFFDDRLKKYGFIPYLIHILH